MSRLVTSRLVYAVRIALLVFIALLLVASPVLGYLYRASVAITETSSNAYTMLPVMWTSPNQWMADNGFMKSTALDTRVQTLGGSNKPHMVADDRTLTAIPVPADSQTNLFFATGESDLTAMDIITGQDGYLTTKDVAALEGGNNFQDDISGYIKTSEAGDYVSKAGAYGIATDGAGNATGYIGANPVGFSQVIVGGTYDTLAGAGTEYNVLMGTGVWNATESANHQLMPTAGTISSLYVQLSANVGAGATQIITLMKNGAATALTVTISAGASTGNDTGHSVSFVAGDTVSLRSTVTGAPGTPVATWSTIWTPTTAGESIMLMNLTSNTIQTWYGQLQGVNVGSATEAYYKAPMPTAGTFSKLYVKLTADPGTAPDNYRFYLRKNTANSALTVNVIADATTGNDTVNTVSVVAGDIVNYAIVPENTPSTASTVAMGLVFVSSTSGESVILGGAALNAPSAAAVNYYELSGGINANWDATEANRYQLANAMTISKFYVWLNAAPDNGGGVQYVTLAPRANAGVTGLSVTISEADTTGNDVINSYSITSSGTTVGMQNTPSGTPSASTLPKWGLVSVPYSVSISDAVADGDHRVRFGLSGGTLSIQINADVAVTTAFAGSVPDTASNLIWGADAAYLNYVKHNVGGVEVLQYQPVSMILGREYSTGTVTVTNGDATVEGAGGATWTDAMAGSIFVSADGAYYVVSSVTDVDTLELAAVYAGGTLAGQTYALYPLLSDETGTYDAAITWGANPAGVSVTVGSMTSSGQADVGTVTDDPTTDRLPVAGTTDWNVEPDVSGALLTNPLRPLIVAVSDNTQLTESQTWIWFGIAVVAFATVLVGSRVHGHHGITAFASGAATVALVVMTIFPLQALIYLIICALGGLVSERSSSL